MSLSLLEGVRVLDITTTLSGPYATMLLADLGADVVKIEPPTGDPSRDLGPRVHDDMGAYFINTNRNKRSVVLDLKSTEGRATLLCLAGHADAVVHNMRPEAAARCGADAETLRAANPALVHCAIRGYGADGPYRDKPAYDDIIQAASGIAAQQEWVAGRPQYVVAAVADKVTGMAAAMAVAAALRHREATGEGSTIEIPMYETIASFGLVEHLWGRTFDPPLGEARYPRVSSPARRPFRTADGWLSVLVYTNEHWARFFAIIGSPDLARDPRFATLASRSHHVEELCELVEAALAEGTCDEWLARLGQAGIPAARYARVDDLFTDPHLQATGFFHEVDHPTEGRLLQVPTPIVVDGHKAGAGRPTPRLGADTESVLAELPD